jgi:predicted HicB family RNase H-like nuclease
MKPYKGYRAAVSFDEDALVFHGEVLGLRDVVTFQATTAEGLRAAFHDSVDDYLQWCEKDGVEPEKPYSGLLSLRTSAELHRQMSDAAARQAKSLNQWMVEALARSAVDDLDRFTAIR